MSANDLHDLARLVSDGETLEGAANAGGLPDWTRATEAPPLEFDLE